MKTKEAMTAFACVTGIVMKFQQNCEACKSYDLCKDYLKIIFAHGIETRPQRLNLIHPVKKQEGLNFP